MCSKLLRHEPRHGWLYNVVERGLTGLTQGYRRALVASLDVRWLVLLVGAVVAGASVLLFGALKQELAPVEDRGVVLGVFVGPEGATIDYTDRYGRQLEQIYAQTKDSERYFVVSGNPVVSQGISFLGLTDWDERNRKSMDVQRELGPKLFALPGVMAFPILPQSLGQSPRAKPVEVVIVSSSTYEELEKIVDRVVALAQKNPQPAQSSKPTSSSTSPRSRCRSIATVRRTPACRWTRSGGRSRRCWAGGRSRASSRQGEQYDVIVQMLPADRTNPEDISNIFVRGRDDQMVPLSSLVTSRVAVAPRELNHFGQRRSATITANLAPGYSLGEALGYMEGIVRQELPPGAALDYNGISREFRVSAAGLYFTFLLALGFIYLVLAAQFESFRDPFIIMLTVPLSMTGALAALYLTGTTLNVYSQIGLVTLVGLITKHGILIVEFANQVQLQGRSVRDAVIESAVLRLRPILMTTGAMVLGAIPLALAHGAGAESRKPIGWVIVGGLLLGTLLTLFVVPTVYTLLARRHQGPAQDEQEPKPVAPAHA